MKTIVYIDGFNLYYRALKGTPHKWLNPLALSQAVLPASHTIIELNYYTARVSGRTDPHAPARQHAYLRALSSVATIKLHFGNFLANSKWAGLIQPLEFRPLPTSLTIVPQPQVALVWKTEEKGSDVKLGCHLVRDACQGKMERAAVLTNDTDLCEPIKIASAEFGIPVTLLTPVNNPATSLIAVANDVRHINGYLGPCQFPAQVRSPNGKMVVKPATW